MSLIDNVKELKRLGFNDDKTKELIESIKDGENSIGVEDLNMYLRKQGLITKVHVGRKRNYVEVSPKIFGVDLSKQGEDLNEFFKQHMEMGKIKFIPDSDEKKLINIESAVRMQKRRNSIGYDDSFIPLPLFREFQILFEEKKKEYFEVRDGIVDKWDDLILRFKTILKISLDALNSVDKEKVYTSIIERLPSKEEYANSFYMNISAKAFPVSENLEMFDEDIQKQINQGITEETIVTMYDIIANTLNDAFENVNKVIIGLTKNDKIASKTLGSIKKTADRIGQKNIFSNKMIDEIKEDIKELPKLSSNTDEVLSMAEVILSKAYGYAKELGLDSSINTKNCSLSEDELLDIYDLISNKVEDQLSLDQISA